MKDDIELNIDELLHIFSFLEISTKQLLFLAGVSRKFREAALMSKCETITIDFYKKFPYINAKEFSTENLISLKKEDIKNKNFSKILVERFKGDAKSKWRFNESIEALFLSQRKQKTNKICILSNRDHENENLLYMNIFSRAFRNSSFLHLKNIQLFNMRLLDGQFLNLPENLEILELVKCVIDSTECFETIKNVKEVNIIDLMINYSFDSQIALQNLAEMKNLKKLKFDSKISYRFSNYVTGNQIFNELLEAENKTIELIDLTGFTEIYISTMINTFTEYFHFREKKVKIYLSKYYYGDVISFVEKIDTYNNIKFI